MGQGENTKSGKIQIVELPPHVTNGVDDAVSRFKVIPPADGRRLTPREILEDLLNGDFNVVSPGSSTQKPPHGKRESTMPSELMPETQLGPKTGKNPSLTEKWPDVVKPPKSGPGNIELLPEIIGPGHVAAKPAILPYYPDLSKTPKITLF